MSRPSSRRMLPMLLLHAGIGALALYYAWMISDTRYVTTAVQFVSPLAVLLLGHLAWLAICRELEVGFAAVVFKRTLGTAAGIVAFTTLAATLAPMPATADAAGVGSAIGVILAMLACLAVIAAVVLAVAGFVFVVFYAIGLCLDAVYIYFSDRSKHGPKQGRLYDVGVTATALCIIAVASLEGTAPGFSFDTRDRAASTITVAAPPARVWQEIGRATSPDFPLPLMLKTIPQPVAVIVDEGAALGARRVVRFRGREGEGDLVLRVVRRSDDEVEFEAVSDESPIAEWVRHKALVFRVTPSGDGSLLTVSLHYERLLAPAWFFRPYVGLAAHLAVNVLARDTGRRAEAPR